VTRIATVTAVLPDGGALVTVPRETACGHDCGRCGGCGAQAGSLTVRAAAAVPVAPGDRVVLESGGVLGAAALVYLLPVALFFLGCLVPLSAPAGRYLCGGLGFALGLLAAAACDRRARKKGTIRYQISRKL